MKLATSFRIALMSGVAIVATSPAAFAQDADDFVAKVTAAYAAFGYNFEFGPATMDGDTIVIDGATVTIANMPDGTMEPFTIDTELTFTGVAQQPDGSFLVDELTVPDVDVTIDDGHVVVQNISFRDLYVPGSAEPTMIEALQVLGQFSAGPMSLDVEGQNFLTIESVAATNEFLPQVGPDLESMTSVATMEGLVAHLDIIPEPEAQAIISALGIETVTGSFRELVGWTMADGRMTVDEFSFTFDDLGKIDFTFDIVGYTPALLQQLADVQKQIMELTEAGDTAGVAKLNETLGMTIMSQLSIGGLGTRYDDAGLAPKLLEFFASQQNLTAADLAAALKQMVASQIPAELGEPLTSQINDAVGAFLDDPQSLEVSVAPAEPVNVMMFAMMAAQPQALLPMLNVTVAANVAAEDASMEEAEESAEEEAPAEEGSTMDASPAEEPAAEKLGN